MDRSVHDSMVGNERSSRRYEIRTNPPPGAQIEIDGWLIGHGLSTQSVMHEELSLTDHLHCDRHTEAWMFVTLSGTIVSALATTGPSQRSWPEPSATETMTITADWVCHDISLSCAAIRYLELLRRHPGLSVSAIIATITEAHAWLKRTGRVRHPNRATERRVTWNETEPEETPLPFGWQGSGALGERECGRSAPLVSTLHARAG